MNTTSSQSFELKLYKKFEDSLRSVLEIVKNDPLLDCFRENIDTEKFMIDRIEEILKSCMADISLDLKAEVFKKYTSAIEKIGFLESSLKQKEKEIENIIKGNSTDIQKSLDKQKNNSIIDKNAKNYDDSNNQNNNNSNNNYSPKTIDRYSKISKSTRSLNNNKSQIVKTTSKYNFGNEEENTKREIDYEKKTQALKVSIRQYEQEVNQNNLKIKNLEDEIEQKNKTNQSISEKLGALEQERENLIRKLEETSQNERIRLESKLRSKEERISNLEKRLKDFEKSLENSNETDKIKEINKQKNDLNEKISELQNQLEEKYFSSNQHLRTIEALKKEISSLNSKISEERKERNQLELQSIDIKDKNSNLLLENSDLKEKFSQLEEEFEFLSSKHQKAYEDLKNQRREAADWKRQVEEVKFSTESIIEDNKEELIALKEKILYLKKENGNLTIRIEQLLTTNENKYESYRKQILDLQEKIRCEQEKSEKYEVKIENLQKSVEFYKDKSVNCKNDTEDKFSAYKQRLNSKSSSKQKFIRKYKESLKKISVRVVQLRKEFECEKSQLKNDIKFYRESLIGIYKTLSTTVKEEILKNIKTEKEMIRMRRDIDYLKSLNDSFRKRREQRDSIKERSSISSYRKKNNDHPKVSSQNKEFRDHSKNFHPSKGRDHSKNSHASKGRDHSKNSYVSKSSIEEAQISTDDLRYILRKSSRKQRQEYLQKTEKSNKNYRIRESYLEESEKSPQKTSFVQTPVYRYRYSHNKNIGSSPSKSRSKSQRKRLTENSINISSIEKENEEIHNRLIKLRNTSKNIEDSYVLSTSSKKEPSRRYNRKYYDNYDSKSNSKESYRIEECSKSSIINSSGKIDKYDPRLKLDKISSKVLTENKNRRKMK